VHIDFLTKHAASIFKNEVCGVWNWFTYRGRLQKFVTETKGRGVKNIRAQSGSMGTVCKKMALCMFSSQE
jgi:hypothetical protein